MNTVHPLRPRPDPAVFAVEDTSIQVTWSGLPVRPGLTVTVEAGGVEAGRTVDPPAWLHHRTGWSRRLDPRPGGPGSLVLEGLAPGVTYPVWMSGPGLGRTCIGTARTLDAPPGALLARFATISDTHIGERAFGVAKDIVDVHGRTPGVEPYPVRAARAALEEAAAWGAGLMVVKGDVTDHARPAEAELARRLLAGSGLPCVVQLGNHDVAQRTDVRSRLHGLDVPGPGTVTVRDLPGVRIVLGHSPIDLDRPGDLDGADLDALTEAVAGAPGPAVVTLHHPPRPHRRSRFYPPGLLRPASRRLTAALQAANPATMVLAGHTHRHRRYRVDGTEVVEVGSTKDYPGVWAGYAVHEHGIRQVVRRLGRPDVIAWTEATATALGGQWGRWSPGRLDDRCWSHTWPGR